MTSLGRWSANAVFGGLLTGSLMVTAATDAGDGKFRPGRWRNDAAVPLHSLEQIEVSPLYVAEPVDDVHEIVPEAVPLLEPPAACLPPKGNPRVSYRVVPYGDAIGTPIHHLNFSGDCYGENWRTQNWFFSNSHAARFHQRTQSHSLGKERWWNQLFGNLPRGYIHDTSGHPLRSFFVTQPSDPTLAYVPGSDTLTPPHVVMDYGNYVYQPGLPSAAACGPGTDPAVRSAPIPAIAPQ